MDIAKLLKNRRLDLGISQGSLASHCGFAHRSNVSRLEAGKLEWKWKDVMTACELLELEIDVQER